MFTRTAEVWQPWPTPDEARRQFDALLQGINPIVLPGKAIARLIILGEVIEEAEIRPSDADGSAHEIHSSPLGQFRVLVPGTR